MSSSSSVSKLHDDILWYIFMLNSHPITCPIDRDAHHLLGIGRSGGSPPEPSMITTRRTSQVCRQWREVLLGSHGHIIWANTLDLQYLNQKGDLWREEIFRRTGNAPLTVVGHVGARTLFFSSPPQNVFAIPFLLELLSAHWERIRVLVIVSAGMEVNGALRIALNRSAPVLEHCVVQFDRTGGVKKIVPFAKDAPSLSSFSIYDHGLHLSALSWACKLRYLNLKWPQARVVTSEVLHHLEKLPLLETLYLYFEPSYDQLAEIMTPKTFISLPRLKHLTLVCPPAPDLLPYINIPPQCTITMYGGYQNLQRGQTYSNSVQAHFPDWNIVDISFKVELIPEPEPEGELYPYYTLIMKDSLPERDDHGHIIPQFEYSDRSMEMSVAVSMATALSSCRLDRITTFHLNLFVLDTFIDDPSFDTVYNFIRNLEFVKTLQTDKHTLRFLKVAEGHCDNLLFPKLRTIIVDGWDVWVERFLDSRKEGGMIERVLFSGNSRVRVREPSVLEKAARLGISVVWKISGQEVEFPPNSVVGS